MNMETQRWQNSQNNLENDKTGRLTHHTSVCNSNVQVMKSYRIKKFICVWCVHIQGYTTSGYDKLLTSEPRPKSHCHCLWTLSEQRLCLLSFIITFQKQQTTWHKASAYLSSNWKENVEKNEEETNTKFPYLTILLASTRILNKTL